MQHLRTLAFATLLVMSAAAVCRAQSWQPLTHQPQVPAGALLLLTDGTVLVHHEDPNDGYSEWYKLTPDANGTDTRGCANVLTADVASPCGATTYNSSFVEVARVE